MIKFLPGYQGNGRNTEYPNEDGSEILPCLLGLKELRSRVERMPFSNLCIVRGKFWPGTPGFLTPDAMLMS